MKKPLLFACALALTLVGTVHAQDADSDELRATVQAEMERLLAEGAMDNAIQGAIEAIIAKQQAGPQGDGMRPVDPDRDHIRGEITAPFTLVEYSDFECPYCKSFHPTAMQLMDDNPGQLRWVYRHFPLSFHNPGAEMQAEASECVAELGGNDAFWAYADAIYDRTRAGGNGLHESRLRPMAEEVGVDGDAFATCMASGRMAVRVQQDYDNGVAVGVSGTPAGFLFGNSEDQVYFIAGAQPLATLQSVLDGWMQ